VTRLGCRVEPRWQPSPYRFSGTGHAAEVAVDPYDGWWLVRDAEDPDAPQLAFSPTQWVHGIGGVPAGLYIE